MEVSGSGVLILTHHHVLSVVLIYCPDKGVWEDPGGRVDQKGVGVYEHDIVSQSARKELYEETACLFDVKTKKMYRNFIDVPIKKKKGDNFVYRCYFMRIDNINLKRYYNNLERLYENSNTPRHYLETNDIAIIPLIAFTNIIKKRGKFGIMLGERFYPISNRINRIMRGGGFDISVNMFQTIPAKSLLNKRPKNNIRGWKKGTVTYII